MRGARDLLSDSSVPLSGRLRASKASTVMKFIRNLSMSAKFGLIGGLTACMLAAPTALVVGNSVQEIRAAQQTRDQGDSFRPCPAP